MNPPIQRFACTQCGKCCDRSPEVELSEAAALADVFVFRLMFRLYSLPRALADYREFGASPADGSALFYERKRLLAAYCARKHPIRRWRNGKAVEYTQYLLISALTFDAGSGACSALWEKRCSIYDRRPLGCRTVPFHYSRAETSAEWHLKAFVATPGYRCATDANAARVLEDGRIVDPEMWEGRAEALALAERERPWKRAIVRWMKAAPSGGSPLPNLHEIEANALFGATTTSMRIAWQIAAESGLMEADECRRLIATQLATIDRELAAGSWPQDARETLVEMRTDYLKHCSANAGGESDEAIIA